MRVTVQLARTRAEHEGALRLMHRARKELMFNAGGADESGLWLTKHHALPSANTVIAKADGRVVGALTLFGESPYRLPLESRANLRAFREGLGGRLAEISYPASEAHPAHESDILLALYQYAVCFGASYCHYDGFLTELPRAWAEGWRDLLRYEPLYPAENSEGLALYRAAREGADYRRSFSRDFDASFVYPERKFFLVAHQSLDPATLHYLFNQQSRLFETLSDEELRVLRNVYDQGAYASAIPSRKLSLPFAKIPHYRRFPMICDGLLSLPSGQRAGITLLDASREGLKARLTELPRVEATYPLLLEIGVHRRAELIARCVWADERARVAGFEVKNEDPQWRRLIEYLECDFLRTAA